MKKFSLETYAYLPKIKAPIYIFHGMEDQLIPFKNSVRLNGLLKSDKNLFLLKNQDHIGINENEEFQDQLKIILL